MSNRTWLSPDTFRPVLKKAFEDLDLSSTLFNNIMNGLSQMDKNAEIQKDKKGNIIYDKESKDTEIVKFNDNIEDYMKREVLPYVPDAKWFFEEKLTGKKPKIKTGAEIPFTRYFYKYQQPIPSKELISEFLELEDFIGSCISELFMDK